MRNIKCVILTVFKVEFSHVTYIDIFTQPFSRTFYLAKLKHYKEDLLFLRQLLRDFQPTQSLAIPGILDFLLTSVWPSPVFMDGDTPQNARKPGGSEGPLAFHFLHLRSTLGTSGPSVVDEQLLRQRVSSAYSSHCCSASLSPFHSAQRTQAGSRETSAFSKRGSLKSGAHGFFAFPALSFHWILSLLVRTSCFPFIHPLLHLVSVRDLVIYSE